MKNIKENYREIKGWGIDAEDELEIRQSNDWNRPPQEAQQVELLMSNERENLPAVIGQTVPPSGLSGQLRRYAFTHSESRYRHWLPLLIADRINEIEGVLDDLRKGKCPNILAERGWNARWKYDRAKLIKQMAGAALVGLLIVRLCRKR